MPVTVLNYNTMTYEICQEKNYRLHMRPVIFFVGDAQRASRLIPISWRAALWDGPTIYGLRYFPCLSDEAADDVGDSQVFRSSPVGHGVVDEILRADAGMRQDFD